MSGVLKRVRSAFNRKNHSSENASPSIKTDAPSGLAASFFQTKDDDDNDDDDDDDKQRYTVSNKKPYISPGNLKRNLPTRSPSLSENSVDESVKKVPIAPSNITQSVPITPQILPSVVKNEEPKPNPPQASEIAKTTTNKNQIEFSQENTFPFAVNPNSQLIGFPTNRPSTSTRFDLMLRQMRLKPSILSSFQLATGIRSRVEIDFPTNEVVVDPSLSPSVAFKINEAIERDRFGKAYKSYRYAYQPMNQRITFDHHPSTGSRGNHGIRFIREVTPTSVSCNQPSIIIPVQSPTSNYSSTVPTLSNLPIIVPIESSNTYYSYPMPAVHYTAWASADDPMRIYR